MKQHTNTLKMGLSCLVYKICLFGFSFAYFHCSKWLGLCTNNASVIRRCNAMIDVMVGRGYINIRPYTTNWSLTEIAESG